MMIWHRVLNMLVNTFRETVREHEHYMDSLMRKLKGNGEGVSDPFVMVEKPDDKYPSYDDKTHWRLKKPKVLSLHIFFIFFLYCVLRY